MNWFGWFLVAYWGVNALYVVSQVGKPSKPVSGGAAAFVVVFMATFAVLMITVGTGR